MNPLLIANYKAIATNAISRGLARTNPSDPTKNWQGRERKNKQRPELKGLHGKYYHRAYMRLIRKGTIDRPEFLSPLER